MRGLRKLVTIAAIVVHATGCRDTNIEPPGPADLSGGIIVFASNRADNNAEIYLVSADGRGLRRLTDSRDANDRAPALSPDGSLIAWEREVTRPSGDVAAVELWTMRTDGSDARAVVSNGSFNRSPSWAPDGSLYFSSRVTGSDQIFVLRPGASAPQRLTTGGAADQYPRVSPDGQRVLFQSNRGLDFDVYVMNADGTGIANLTARPGDDRFPAWTPDGARVLWTRFDDAAGNFDIWALDADGGNAAPLLASPFNELMPSVSPDGLSLVVQSDRSPPARLFITPLAGGTPRALGSDGGSGSDEAPWWGPAP